MLSPELASRFASLALAHVTRAYPHKVDHIIRSADELRPPRELHPIFYGSFDWHSCVHGYWLLATLHRTRPSLPERVRIARVLSEHLTLANVAAELAYLAPAERATFERPYGWAWLLMLQAELLRQEGGEADPWSAILAPLAAAFVYRFSEWLPKATYPIRSGAHFNTAFALSLALEYAA
ncbi:MAG: DUF2891 family protein, partial [Gemmatimonadaceae bacterium]